MSVEKMDLVNIVGPENMLDEVLRTCCITEKFHPENSSEVLTLTEGGTVSHSSRTPQERFKTLCDTLELSFEELPEPKHTITKPTGDEFRVTDPGESVPTEDVIVRDYTKLCFGRMTADDYRRLQDYKSRYIIFVLISIDSDYATGTFFAKTAQETEGNSFELFDEQNPWVGAEEKIRNLCSELKLRGGEPDFCVPDKPDSELPAIIDGLSERYNFLINEKKRLKDYCDELNHGIIHISHMTDIDVSLDEVFEMEYIKLRFGRMPRSSYEKMKLYNDSDNFLFIPSSIEKQYVWGVCFVPSSLRPAVDDLLASLFFERFHIPEEAHGTPSQALAVLREKLQDATEQLTKTDEELKKFSEENSALCLKLHSRLICLRDCFEFRRLAVKKGSSFVLCGWVAKSDYKSFAESMGQLRQVSCKKADQVKSKLLTPPTKLKNLLIFRPFEFFVKMYGVPAYNEIDPTPLLAITYTILFGIMFGDVGHGLVLLLLGILGWRLKKIKLCKIIGVIGASSMVFGFLFGSVFGYEELLTPVHEALFGTNGKLFEVTAPENMNLVLYGAVGAGAVILIISILVNIINGIRQHDMRKALFSQNGTAGIVFYASVLLAVVMILLFGKSILNPVFIICFVVIPLLVMFLQEPLANLFKKNRAAEAEGEKTSVVGFIMQNFFEMFEVILSFITNTLSFMRVGIFAMSHAFMMSVVFMLAQSASGTNPIVAVIGNLLVIGLEGLIVGIQVLRLQFYEILGHFYSGNGKEFSPARISTLNK